MRKLKNWISSYLEYTEDTESAPIFHKWVGMSLIAAALRKKTCLSLGRIKVYPNLYVVLVGEPGIVRKTQAIKFGELILAGVPALRISADAITPQALLEEMEQSADDNNMPNGDVFRHNSLSIISKEFESFLGQKKENTKMLVILTDLFDCPETPWRYRTKHSRSSTIDSAFLNLLAATTPESINSSLPSSAIGGGLTSRIIYIWASKKRKKVAYPEKTKKMEQIELGLIQDLSVIARISGEFILRPRDRWEEWYNEYNERDPKRICKDPAFNGWYSRKFLFILKLAMGFSAAEGDSRDVEWEHIEKGMALLEEAETYMGRTFSAVGRSEISVEVDIVAGVIEQHRHISEKQLVGIVWRDAGGRKFDEVMGTLIKRGIVVRKFKNPHNNRPEVWYSWVGEGEG